MLLFISFTNESFIRYIFIIKFFSCLIEIKLMFFEVKKYDSEKIKCVFKFSLKILTKCDFY